MRNKIKTIEDEIGNTYNYLTVLEETEPKLTNAGYLARRWIFQCICGNEKSLYPGNVFSGSIKSCGCKKTEVTREAIKKYYGEKYEYPVEGRLYSSYKKHGKKFELSSEEFIELVNSKCHYCGIEPTLIRYNKTKSVAKPLNGIDRIDSSKGYFSNNVVPCCPQCNRAKLDMSVEEFLDFINRVFNWQHMPSNQKE